VNAARLLALFTIFFVIGIALAAGAAHEIAKRSVPERHHIYWCYVTAHTEWQGHILSYQMSLPCMYRTNTPIAV
jgi:hypothetical protein